MVILEVRSIFQSVNDYRDNPNSLAAQSVRNNAVNCGSDVPGSEMEACWYQIAFQGSIYTDEGVPTFTYPGRQEMFECMYDSQETLIKRLRNSFLNGSLTYMVFWKDASLKFYTSCTNNISIMEVIKQLMIEFPNKVHIIPNNTDIIGYLKHIGIPLDIVPTCDIQRQITGIGSAIDIFNGIIKVNKYVNSDTVNITIITPWKKTVTMDVNSGITIKFEEPYTVYNINIDSIFNLDTKFVQFTSCYAKSEPSGCISNWICNDPKDGWESDGCGYSRYNLKCDPNYVEPIKVNTGNILITGGIAVGLFYLVFRK